MNGEIHCLGYHGRKAQQESDQSLRLSSSPIVELSLSPLHDSDHELANHATCFQGLLLLKTGDP